MVDIARYTENVPAAPERAEDVDFAALAATLAADSAGLLKAWLPAGKKAGKNYVVGNLQGDKGHSLSIDLATGKWIDFASGDAGNDLISLYGRMYGLGNLEAALELGGPSVPIKVRSMSSIKPIKVDRVELERVWVVAPPWQEKCPCRHIKFGNPSMSWTYRDEGGKVIGIIARYDPRGERKQFVPWTWNGASWEPKGWAGLRPLYGLHEIMSMNPHSVLLVEGEKACEAARKIVGPDWFVATWPGGAQAINRVDWSPLKGRYVMLWPDADEPGVKAMHEIRKAIDGKAEQVAVLDVSNFPAKWDAADALADGWDQARFTGLISSQFGGQPAEVIKLDVVKRENTRPAKPAHQEVPPHLLQIPGVLGDGVSWMLSTMMTPQPIYAVQTMLALGSVALGRNHKTTFDNWSALYFCIIGGSGTGKESVKTALDRVLSAAELHDLAGFSHYSSGAGLMSSLIAHPNHLYITDEFGKYLDSLKEKGNGLKREVAKLMIELWGRVNGTQKSSGMSTNNLNPAQIAAQSARYVIKPSLIQVAMSTEDQFYNALNTDSVTDGFLNRYLTVHCREKRTAGKLRKQTPPPQSLVEWVTQMRVPVVTGNLGVATAAIHNAEPTPHIMDFDDESIRMIDAFNEECVVTARPLDEICLGELWGRSNEISMRLSMIIARSCGSSTIRSEHLKWAQDYVRFHTDEYVRDVQEHVSDSEFAGAMQDVSRLIKAAGEHGITEFGLTKASRKFRKLHPRLQVDIVEMLRRNNQIETVERRNGIGGRGRTGKYHCWVGGGDS